MSLTPDMIIISLPKQEKFKNFNVLLVMCVSDTTLRNRPEA